MEFEGFQHSLPAVLVVLTAAFLIGIAWLSYRKLHSIPPVPKAGLIILRSSAFLIILILLLNPFFFSRDTVKTNPRILFMLDDTESTAIQKGDYDGLSTYQRVLENLKRTGRDQIDIEYFTIGSESRQLAAIDSLKFDQSETNFTSAIAQIQELEDDFDAAILVSDGIITFGKNPIIQASDLIIPLYTIGLGDTSKVKDITINTIRSNPTGYTNTRHIVEVEILQNGFEGEETAIRILDSGGTLLASKQAEFVNSDEIRTLQFELDLTEPGLKQFQVQAETLNGEWSEENNRSSFSVDVSESKINMIHISFEVHPDVKMVRDILMGDENINLTTRTWLGGDRFVESGSLNLYDYDLVIVHGLPVRGFNYDLFGGIDQLPSLYLQLPKSRLVDNSPLSEIQLIANSGRQLFQVGLYPDADYSDHPILELPEVNYQNLPPLYSSLQTRLMDPGAEIILKSSYQGVESPNSLLAVLERGSVRRAMISGWGWFKLYQSSIDSEREYVTELIINIAAWTSNDPDERRLKISPVKPVFNLSEEVIINANLNNESGEPESEGIIEVTIRDDEADSERIFNMSNNGEGSYSLEVSSLASGLYSYSATARKGDREIDSQNGEFLIENSNSELINTIRNDELLSALSNETNGEYLTYEDADRIWNVLNADDLLESGIETVESYTFPVRNIFWFILVLIFLASEWVIRKYYSLP